MKKILFIISKSLKALIGIINLKFVISLILLSSFLPAKSTNFHAAYNCQNLSSITAVAISEDGADGFMAVVSGISIYTGYETINLVKLDNQFNVVWTKYLDYPINPIEHIRAYDIKKDPNGGYAICGMFRPTFNVELGYMMKIDDNGNMLWIKDASDANLTLPRCKEIRAVEIVNNNYYACGYAADNTTEEFGYLWCLDPNTQQSQWVRLIDDFSASTNIRLNDIAYNSTTDKIYSCGSWFVNGNAQQAVVASYDLSGGYNFINLYNDGNIVAANTLCANQNDIYISGGLSNNTNFHMISIDANNGTVNAVSNSFDIEQIDEVEDMLYYNNNLYYCGSVFHSSYNFYQGMFLQTDMSATPVSTALFSGVYSTGAPYEEIKFYKMLYRTTYSNPSIIMIGISNNNASFYISEINTIYSEACNDISSGINTNPISPNSTGISEQETGNDMPDLPTTQSLNDNTDLQILCDSPNWLTAPQEMTKNNITKQEIAEQTEFYISNNKIIFNYLAKNTILHIYTMDGRLLQKHLIEKQTDINISSLPKGIYILSIQSENNAVEIHKFIK